MFAASTGEDAGQQQQKSKAKAQLVLSLCSAARGTGPLRGLFLQPEQKGSSLKPPERPTLRQPEQLQDVPP